MRQVECQWQQGSNGAQAHEHLYRGFGLSYRTVTPLVVRVEFQDIDVTLIWHRYNKKSSLNLTYCSMEQLSLILKLIQNLA